MWFWLFLFTAAGTAVLHRYWRRRFDALSAASAAQARRVEVQVGEFRDRLARQEAQQSALFDSMAEGVLVLDPGGRIHMVNRALTSLLHLNGEPRGRTIMEAIRSHELQALVKRASAEGEVLNAELELPGLKERQFQVNATLIEGGEGRANGMLIVFHDLTRLKQLENTRREFVANVSHELRTPLSMIKGYVETLLDGGWEDKDAAPRFLHIIQKHANRLTFLIEDLLTISRLESGQIAMNIEPVELQAVVTRVLDDVRTLATGKNVKLRNDIPSQLIVKADEERLQQVFLNLVDNAIKYGRPEGKVSVTAEYDGEELVRCCVGDDGPGIPQEAIDRIFERFYRVDRARSREQGGTGLGLSIVKHIIQANGGQVWAESEPGKGTRFYFTLPRA